MIEQNLHGDFRSIRANESCAGPRTILVVLFKIADLTRDWPHDRNCMAQACQNDSHDAYVTKLFGPVLTLCVVLVGLVAWRRARSPEDAVEALHSLGTLMTLTTGVLSAVWWHKSAGISEKPLGSGETERVRRSDARVLNGAAATTTGLALVGGLFSGLSWQSPQGVLAALAFLLMLGISGDEICLAAILSWRHGPHLRSALAVVVVVVAIAMFAVRWLIK